MKERSKHNENVESKSQAPGRCICGCVIKAITKNGTSIDRRTDNLCLLFIRQEPETPWFV
jgi:hypothetical protein